MSQLSYSHLPKTFGVYLFLDETNKVLYVGKAKNLFNRVSSYFQKDVSPKTRLLLENAYKIDFITVESEVDALILEANLIKKYKPKYNIDLKDDKRYPYIEITTNSEFPLVRIVRRETDPKAKYFGPYPTGSEISKTMRFLRTVFPYASASHPGMKKCFRSHLGLCPCGQSKDDYKKNLKNLIGFLSGERKNLILELEKEMNKCSHEENYQKAAELKQQIDKLRWLTTPKRDPFEYESDHDLVANKYRGQILELEKVLGIENIHRIECYDISNTSGTLATSAMVVSIDGVAKNSEYRKFRIKSKSTPDDPAMIAETINRRLNHLDDWGKPDLLVVDGGSTQLTAAKIELAKKEISIPIISLAKREEEIYLQPDLKIKLERNSGALQAIQRLRDEAHRFSRSYHFVLRKKKMLS